VAFLAAKARQSGPAGDAIPVGARPLSHRDRKGLRCRQTLVRRSGFADRKTQPRRGSAGGDESAGGAARDSDAGAIGPPSQQVSRIAPHWRHMSLARISNVSPWQIGQRQAVMPLTIPDPRPEGHRAIEKWTPGGTAVTASHGSVWVTRAARPPGANSRRSEAVRATIANVRFSLPSIAGRCRRYTAIPSVRPCEPGRRTIDRSASSTKCYAARAARDRSLQAHRPKAKPKPRGHLARICYYPEHPSVDTCLGTVRGHPRPLAGRSLRASMPSAHSKVPALCPPGFAGHLRRLPGHG